MFTQAITSSSIWSQNQTKVSFSASFKLVFKIGKFKINSRQIKEISKKKEKSSERVDLSHKV